MKLDDIPVDILEQLTPDELAAIERIARGPEPVWSPSPGPQTMAYESTADIIGYGGAAGGGKTDLALGKACTQFPTSVIYRRAYPELMGIKERIAAISGGWDGHSGQDKVWRWEDHERMGTRKIEYASIQHMGNPDTGPRDERDQQGRPRALIVFDEAVNFSEYTVRFLMGWNRYEDPAVHCQTLLTMNPPMDADGLWVIEYFAPWLDKRHPRPAVSGELRWFVYDPKAQKDVEVEDGTPIVIVDGVVRHASAAEIAAHKAKADGALEVSTPRSRTFIFSSVTDNPHYRDTGYYATLQSLPEPMRSRLLKGEFLVDLKDHALQVIPQAWVEAAMERWIDLPQKPPMDSMGVDVARGGKDRTVIAKRHGYWYDRDVVHPGADTPNGRMTAALILAELRDNAPIHIDAIGVGASPYDKLVELERQVLGIIASEAAPGSDRTGRLQLYNHRSWMWWRMRDALDPESRIQIALPPDEDLKRELTTPRWTLKGTKIYVESREDIIDRIGKSPDRATAYCLANIATPKTPELYRPDHYTQVARRAYDPHVEPWNQRHATDQHSNRRRDYDPIG